MKLRLARPEDAPGVHAIYAPIVRASASSFEIDPPDPVELRQRIETTLARLPWLVCERDDGLLGYAYAGPYRARPAYQSSVEVSVYVSPRAHRTGVGRRLYGALLALLSAQGFVSAFAGITLPNPASVGLHESLGFTPIGVYRAAGFKLGAWRDVGWWQRRLAEPAVTPAPPLAFPTLPAAEVRQALSPPEPSASA